MEPAPLELGKSAGRRGKRWRLREHGEVPYYSNFLTTTRRQRNLSSVNKQQFSRLDFLVCEEEFSPRSKGAVFLIPPPFMKSKSLLPFNLGLSGRFPLSKYHQTLEFAGVEAASWSSSAASSSACSLAMTRTSLRMVSSQFARSLLACGLPVCVRCASMRDLASAMS